ncbi:stage II sporulation protein E [Thermoanaerobacterium sp. DL9XJH110]|uniref:stage II sporulation protein E n=1 Tax=Thermoanaerobacterium sp. DL9XJH110 TaxID=3386643 RepID=UPI003BB4CEB6
MINKAQIEFQKFNKGKISSLSLNLTGIISSESLWLSLLAFCFGRASLNGLYPFGLSFTAAAALYREKFAAAGLFSLLGIVSAVKSPAALRYFFATAIFTAAFTVLQKHLKPGEFLTAALVFISNALGGLIFLVTGGYSPYDLLLLVMECGLSCIMIFIIPGGLHWVFRVPVGEAEKNICLAVLAGVLLPMAQGLEFSGVNLKDVLGVLAVLVMALINGAGAGAAAGIIIGVTGSSLALSPWFAAIMAFSGLVAGTFHRLGKPGSAAGFVLGYILYNLYVNSMGESIIPLPALIVAVGLFLMIPKPAIKRMKFYLEASPAAAVPGPGAVNLARLELYDMAVLLEEMGKSFLEPLNDEREALRKGYLDRVMKEARSRVCSTCGLCRTCWERENSRTVHAFYELIRNYEENPVSHILPYLFKARCGRIDDIKRIVREQSAVYNLEQRVNSIVRNTRDTICGRFKKAAGIIKALAENWPFDEYDGYPEGKLLDSLARLGVRMEALHIEEDRREYRVKMAKKPCLGERQCESRIPAALTEVLGKKFEIKEVECPLKSGGSRCLMKAVSSGAYGVAVGVAGTAREGMGVSGDGFSFLELKNGKFLLALSDGMGVGEMAARHSGKTLAFLERLLEAGFDGSSALKITNSAVGLCACEESFSTADLALIDTHTGKAEFIKAGSAAGFVKRGSRVEVIKGGSFPVGIMDDISPVVSERHLRPGDMVVMVTDGVLDSFSMRENGDEALRRLLAQARTSNPQEIADGILECAKKISPARDDMTVLVARIWEKSV